MKFGKSNKEPKKTPEEEYAEQISTLSESELRDLHKDLKIDHYGNSAAAAINTASGVGLLSLYSTTRRYKTECMQIEAMEARMKEMGWTPHPNRYRDAVPIALGVAAGTTKGMSFGLINVEKNAQRTKKYVMKKDLFKTKELAEAEGIDSETEHAAELVEEVEIAEYSVEPTKTLEATTEHVASTPSIARKPVPSPSATNTGPEGDTSTHILARKPVTTPAEMNTGPEAGTSQPEGFIETNAIPEGPPPVSTEVNPITEEPSPVSTEIIATETHAPAEETYASTELKMTKKEALFSQVTVMNKKMRSFNFKKDKEEKDTIVSVTEIACDAQGPGVCAG
ncbi:hypothetical protein BDR22DRAFT_183888 [Usnea florida]